MTVEYAGRVGGGSSSEWSEEGNKFLVDNVLRSHPFLTDGGTFMRPFQYIFCNFCLILHVNVYCCLYFSTCINRKQ